MANERIEIFTFSPIFGFDRIEAWDYGALPDQDKYHRVLLDGETTERISPVYLELQGRLDEAAVRALNHLVFSTHLDVPQLVEDTSRIGTGIRCVRRISLPRKGGR